jgi:predicted phage-related endonuclease
MIPDVHRIPISSREEWLTLRKRDVTASDAAAIWGASPHKTALALWAEKSGTEFRSDDNAFARRGRHLEPAILSAAGECEEFAGRLLSPAKEYWRSPSLRMGATPDAYVHAHDETGEPLDAKSVASWVFDTQWSAGPPLHIQIQVLIQAMLMNAPRGWVACAVMTPDWPVYVYEVPRSAEAETKIIAGVAEFWRTVAAKEMPAPVAKDQATLAAMFSRVDPKLPPLDWTEDDVLDLLAEHADLSEELKPKHGRISELEALIKAKIGEAETAVAPGWSVSWKQQKRKAYSVPEGTYRVLRIKSYTPDGETKETA